MSTSNIGNIPPKSIDELIAEVIELRLSKAKQQWISVNDEMPEEEGVYLTHWDDGVIETYDCEIDGNYWDVPTAIFKSVANSKGGISRVTHWQHLPEPPK